MLNTYHIPCTWELHGVVVVEAESIEKAIAKAYEEPSLPDGEYTDDSFGVDRASLDCEIGKCSACSAEVCLDPDANGSSLPCGIFDDEKLTWLCMQCADTCAHAADEG